MVFGLLTIPFLYSEFQRRYCMHNDDEVCRFITDISLGCCNLLLPTTGKVVAMLSLYSNWKEIGIPPNVTPRIPVFSLQFQFSHWNPSFSSTLRRFFFETAVACDTDKYFQCHFTCHLPTFAHIYSTVSSHVKVSLKLSVSL